MNTTETMSKWDDPVFDNRNKDYGAFQIRQHYDENVVKAWAFALMIAGTLLTFAWFGPAIFRDKIMKLPDCKLPIIGLIPEVKIIPDKPIASVTPPVRTNPDLIWKPVTTEPPVIEDRPVSTEPSSSGQVGTTTGGDVSIGDAQGVVVEPPIVAPEPPAIVDRAEVMPMYEGGMAAMMKFLQKNLKYPRSARNMGLEGTVFVRFVVNTEGRVANVEVIRGVTGVLDQEAARVVALMNKWKPGIQHNMPVNVRMVLPIKFQLDQ